MSRFSLTTKVALAVFACGAAVVGIGATHQANTARTAPRLGTSSSSSQKQGGRSSTSSQISGDSREYAEICYDPATGERLENSACEEGRSSSSSSGGSVTVRSYWVPYNSSSTVPKVGEKVSGGSDVRPANGTIFRNLPSQGGGFAESFRESKSSYTVEDSQVKSSRSGESHGGFGGGSKTGGGTAGG